MDHSCFPFPGASNKIHPNLIKRYLSGSDTLSPFYNHFHDLAGYHGAIREISTFQFNREILVQALRDQHTNQNILPHVEQYLDLLSQPNTFTICTGHQLQFLSGPLYFIYKIATTLTLARKLKIEHPDKNFIPVFWLASEDHDKEEIAGVRILGKVYRWPLRGEGAVGRLPVSDHKDLFKDISDDLRQFPEFAEFEKRLEEPYQGGITVSSACTKMIYRLFGEDAPLVIDGDDNRLKKLLVPHILEDVLNQRSFNSIGESSRKLIQAEMVNKSGLQVNPRPCGYFYLSDQSRERLEKSADEKSWIAGNKKWTQQDLVEEIKSHPERFSPDAVNRPLYQQVILPNISYIGGPGELSYWLQLRKFFDDSNVFFPILHLRNSLFILDQRGRSVLKKARLSLDQVAMDQHKIIVDRLISERPELLLDEAEEKIRKVFLDLISQSVPIDPNLEASVKGHHKKVEKSLKRLQRRIMAAAIRKEKLESERIDLARDLFFPGDVPQERIVNVSEFIARFGGSFIQAVLECTDPFDQTPKVLEIHD